MTIVLGLLGPLIILDSTAYCGKWLSDEEKKFLILRQRYTETVSNILTVRWYYCLTTN